MRLEKAFFLLFVSSLLVFVRNALADEIPLIDAHSQLPSPEQIETVIPLMNKAGVHRTILSFRGSAQAMDVLSLAEKNSDRITPAIKIKGKHWPTGSPKFFESVKNQLDAGRFSAMGEVLLYHAAKGTKAPEWTVKTTDKQFRYVLETSRAQGWPLVLHIEFRAAPDPDGSMAELVELLRDNRDVAFSLIHMAQMNPAQVADLISRHPNVYFMVSHSNPITISHTKQPWTNLFDGENMKPEWRTLMVARPERFILNFDNVWEEHWSEDYYVAQARLWQATLATFPKKVAHAIAHGNAERLWHLPPVR